MKKILLSVAVLAVLFTGCKKKDDDPAPTKTKTEYLTAHSWKTSGSISNIAVDADGNSSTPNTTDIWSSFNACEKDDILTFSSNGTGTYADAGTTCGDDFAFTWTLSGNTIVITNTDLDSQTLTLVSVDDNTLKVSYTNDFDYDVTIIETDIFSK